MNRFLLCSTILVLTEARLQLAGRAASPNTIARKGGAKQIARAEDDKCCSTDLINCDVETKSPKLMKVGELPQCALVPCTDTKEGSSCPGESFCISPQEIQGRCRTVGTACDETLEDDECCGPTTCKLLDNKAQCLPPNQGTNITDSMCCSTDGKICDETLAAKCQTSASACAECAGGHFIDPMPETDTCLVRTIGDCGITGCCPSLECQGLLGDTGYYRGCEFPGEGLFSLDLSGESCCSWNHRTCDNTNVNSICNQNILFCEESPCSIATSKKYIPTRAACKARNNICSNADHDSIEECGCCDGLEIKVRQVADETPYLACVPAIAAIGGIDKVVALVGGGTCSAAEDNIYCQASELTCLICGGTWSPVGQ